MVTPGYIPGPLIIPDTVQLRLIWQLPNGKQATNVLHALVAEGFSPSVAIANDVMTSIATDTATTTYIDYLASTTALQRVDIRDVRTALQAIVESTTPALAGTGAGNALPEEVALVVTLRTALAGRAHRGRTYLCGFDDTTLTAEGHAVPGVTGAGGNFISAVRNAMFDSGMGMAIGHRGHAEYVNEHGVTVPAELPGSDLVTAVVCRDNVFDSQRRRK